MLFAAVIKARSAFIVVGCGTNITTNLGVVSGVRGGLFSNCFEIVFDGRISM